MLVALHSHWVPLIILLEPLIKQERLQKTHTHTEHAHPIKHKQVSQSEKSFVSICQQLVCKRWAGYQTSALSWELAEMCLEKQSTQI